MESCICPSLSLTIFSFPPPPFFFQVVTSPVGIYRKDRGRGGCTALTVSYTSRQNQQVRQEISSCTSQPELPLISLSHCRAPWSGVLLAHGSAKMWDVCSALPPARGDRKEQRNNLCAGPLPTTAVMKQTRMCPVWVQFHHLKIKTSATASNGIVSLTSIHSSRSLKLLQPPHLFPSGNRNKWGLH